MDPAISDSPKASSTTHLHDIGDGLEETSHLSVESSDLGKLEQTQSGSESYLSPRIATTIRNWRQQATMLLTLPEFSR